MKYYSEMTKQVYDTTQELEEAETEVLEKEKIKKEKEEARAGRAKEVEAAYIAADEARKKADELLEQFCKDYGSFHTTLKKPMSGLFDSLFDLMFKF